MNASSPPNPKAMILWIIWFSLVVAIVIYQFTLGGGWLRGEDARAATENPAFWIAVGSLFGAAILRWLLLPKAKNIQHLLVLMIFGMALSEAVVFYGIFLFPDDMPQTKMGLFWLSLVSAVLFLPTYASNAIIAKRD